MKRIHSINLILFFTCAILIAGCCACPILFNSMLGSENDFTVDCKNCDAAIPFDAIKGKFKKANRKEIQYVDKGDHILINIRLEK